MKPMLHCLGGVLFLETRLWLIEFLSELSVADQQLAHADEGTHDLNVDGDGTFAVEDRGEHAHASLGEGAGSVAATAAPARSGAVSWNMKSSGNRPGCA